MKHCLNCVLEQAWIFALDANLEDLETGISCCNRAIQLLEKNADASHGIFLTFKKKNFVPDFLLAFSERGEAQVSELDRVNVR